MHPPRGGGRQIEGCENCCEEIYVYRNTRRGLGVWHCGKRIYRIKKKKRGHKKERALAETWRIHGVELHTHVELTSGAAARDVSAEIFLLCIAFL